MTTDQLNPKDFTLERGGDGAWLQEEQHTLGAWSPGREIRLAGCDDDPAENHIVRGID